MPALMAAADATAQEKLFSLRLGQVALAEARSYMPSGDTDASGNEVKAIRALCGAPSAVQAPPFNDKASGRLARDSDELHEELPVLHASLLSSSNRRRPTLHGDSLAAASRQVAFVTAAERQPSPRDCPARAKTLLLLAQDPEAGMGRAAAAGAATLAVQHFLAAGSAPGASAALAVLCAALDRCNQGSTGVFTKAFEGIMGLGDGGKTEASIVTKVMVCTGACGCFLGPPRPFQSTSFFIPRRCSRCRCSCASCWRSWQSRRS